MPRTLTNLSISLVPSKIVEKKGSINDESDDSENEQDTSGVPITCSQQCLDGTPTRINKALWPAITYWIALTEPNGAPANPLVVYRTLLECGVVVTANQVRDYKDTKSNRKLSST